MKKTLKASGISVVLSLLGVAAVGCGADIGDQGAAGDGEQIGQAAQAVVLSPTLTPNHDIHSPGTIKIPANALGTTHRELTLQVGGFTAAGAGVRTLYLLDPGAGTSPDNRFLPLKDAAVPANDLLLPANKGAGDWSIALIPGTTDQFLITGSRLSYDQGAQVDTYVLKLRANGGTAIHEATLFTAGSLQTAAVFGHRNVKKCGDDKLIAFSGFTTAGSKDLANIATTPRIQVFTPNIGSPASGSWAYLTEAVSGSNREVRMTTDRGGAQVLAVDDTHFRIAGGANATTQRALQTSEKLEVNEDCEAIADTTQFNDTLDKLDAGNNLPFALARSSSVKAAVDFNAGSGCVTYDFVLAGGNDNTNGGAVAFGAPLPSILYDAATDSYVDMTSNSNTNGKITVGRYWPHLEDIGGSKLALVTGVQPEPSTGSNPFLFFDNTAATPVEEMTITSTNGACGSGAPTWDQSPGGAGEHTLVTNRFMPAVEFIQSKIYVADGATIAAGVFAAASTVESTK